MFDLTHEPLGLLPADDGENERPLDAPVMAMMNARSPKGAAFGVGSVFIVVSGLGAEAAINRGCDSSSGFSSAIVMW